VRPHGDKRGWVLDLAPQQAGEEIQGPSKAKQNKGLQPTASSVRCAPASSSG
jgi:hypothetical protein